MPRANGMGFLDFLSETVESLLDSDDETDLPEAIRKVARHPLFENHGQIVKRTIERWKVKTAAKMSKLIEALELSPAPTLEPQHGVNASSPVLPPSLQMIHEGIGHQNLVWKGGKQFIAETQNFVLPKPEDRLQRFLQSLRLTDPLDDLAAIRRTKGDIVQGTCAWLLHESKYLAWELDDKHRLLRIQGGPGVGKTMISTFLVDVLEKKAIHNSEMTLAYYFCDNRDERRNTATAILRGLLLQLLRRRSEFFELIQKDYDEMEHRLPELLENLDYLWRIFRRILSDNNVGKVFILVDALDECEKSSRQDFLISLRSLFTTEQIDEQRTIKFLITCRQQEKIDESLLNVGDCLRLDPANTKSDISRFIDDKLDRLPAHYPPALRHNLKTTLSKKSRGSFLWTSLVLDDISKTTVVSKVREKLESLPSTLSEVYDRMLRDFDEDREEAMLILRLVAIARRPLTTIELAMACILCVDREDAELRKTDDVEERRHDYKCCEPLLCYDEKTDTISLVHQSAKDYLFSSSLNASEANFLMLSICWRYFRMEEFHQGTTIIRRGANNKLVSENLPDEFLESHVLLQYAAREWQEHALAAFSSSTSHFTWNSCDLARLPTFRDSWLLRAAANGQEGVTRLLVENDADVTATDERGRTALHRTSLDGCEAVARLLLDKGADSSATDDDGWTALHWASESGHEALVRLLLEKQVDVNLPDDEGTTALHLAVAGRYEALVRLLLENGADVNAKTEDDMTVLQMAFITRSEAIALLLIESGADINAKSGGGDDDDGSGDPPALILAITIRSKPIVQLLLEKGADIDSEFGKTLHVAVAAGHEAIVRLLLDNGAEINAEDEGMTALDIAYLIKNEAIAKLLEEKGGLRGSCNDDEYNKLQNDHNFALYCAITFGSKEGVEAAIRNGADVNARYDDDDSEDEGPMTPLAMAIASQNLKILQLLLEEGADVNADIDNDGIKALHAGALIGDKAMVRLLLEKGADVNAQEDDDGMTALHIAAEGGKDAVVELLLANGADTSMMDHNGETAMDQAYSEGQERVVRLLSSFSGGS